MVVWLYKMTLKVGKNAQALIKKNVMSFLFSVFTITNINLHKCPNKISRVSTDEMQPPYPCKRLSTPLKILQTPVSFPSTKFILETELN